MTWYPRSALVLGLTALVAACGRTPLRESSATASGTGGSGPTTSSASASSGGGSGGEGGHGDVGGSGGMLNGCIVDGPPIGLAGTDGYATTNPAFVVPVQVDGTTLVTAWTAVPGPNSTPIELRHSSFPLWDGWPSDGTIGPSFLAEYDGAQEFYAAPSFTDFSLVFANPTAGIGLEYIEHLTPGSGVLGLKDPIVSGPAVPRFLERSTDPHVHLLGFERSQPALHVFNLIQRTDPFGAEVVALDLGCALAPIVAAAAPLGEGFLVAFSSGSDFHDADCATGVGVTTAQRLFVLRVDKNGKAELAQELKVPSAGAIVTSLKVVPRLDGAWLVWTDTGNEGLQTVRLDPAGNVAGGPFVVPFSGDQGSISATALGDRLAVAWTFSPTDVSPSVQMRLIDPSGAVAVEQDILVDGIAPGRTALLGSPSGKALIVAWTGHGAVAPQVQLGRFACSLP
jgi:hypothetical protein